MSMWKIAASPAAVGAVAAPVVGAWRSSNLTDEDRALLARHYGMDEDSWFGTRNAGRGAVGAAVGALAGGSVGALASAMHAVQRGKSHSSVVPAVAGSVLGALYGTKKMTDKYSRSRADDIRDEYLRRMDSEKVSDWIDSRG